jgi:signal transduction histidine kinase
VLHEFLCAQRGLILARIGSFAASGITGEEHETSAPFFLDHLTAAVAPSRDAPDGIRIDAAGYCDDGLITGLPVGRIVRDSSDLRRAVVELAGETPGAITALELHTFSRCLTDVMAHVVGEFARRREESIHDEQTERLGELAHELRNVLASGSMAFEMLGTGRVAIGGATSFLLARCLTRLSTLVDTTMARVRLESSVRVMERVSVCEFVDDIEVSASMEASAMGLTLAIAPVDPDVDVEVDRHLFVAAISNLLQNAFKFSRPRGHVSLRTSPTRERVLIEVEDQCGGLPPGKAEELFLPFEQRGADRSGLGLGLAISRKSVEAIGGELRVRDIPGLGCAFTIDLPRVSQTP